MIVLNSIPENTCVFDGPDVRDAFELFWLEEEENRPQDNEDAVVYNQDIMDAMEYKREHLEAA